MRHLCIAAAMLCICAVAPAFAEDNGGNNGTPEQLTKALNEGIAMLDSKQYETFIERFVMPEDKVKKLKSKTMDQLVLGFAREKADSLERIFQSLKTKTPEISDDGKKATYTIEMEPRKKQKIEFRRIGNEWYLKN
jgi:hypothetical protein